MAIEEDEHFYVIFYTLVRIKYNFVYVCCKVFAICLTCNTLINQYPKNYISKRMKKSKLILLGLTLTLAACRQEPKDEWISGYDDPQSRDTTVQGHPYRYYHGFYYPIYSGYISPNSYQGGTMQQISSPGYQPSRIQRGGFGRSSSRSSSNS